MVLAVGACGKDSNNPAKDAGASVDDAPVDDQDGDGISNTDEGDADTDGDGTPDSEDADSDNDTIPDQIEGTGDFDLDGIGNWRDPDSDDDCRSDMLESGGTAPPRDSDGDQRFDVVDRDSDGDGLADEAEDANCNGTRDGTETDAVEADSDGDDFSDLVEGALGTDPMNEDANPRVNGDSVFVVPHQVAPVAIAESLAFSTSLKTVDLYVIVDRSGSMSTETTSIKNNMGTVINNLQCPPFGVGAAGTCLSDLHAGLGAVGYTSQEPFRNYLDLQVDPNFAGVGISNVSGTPTTEPFTFATWAAITGMGTADATGCTFSATTTSRSNCPPGTYGYPCFREGALPVVVLVTDETALTAMDTYVCPAWTTVRTAYQARSAKMIGVYGSGATSTAIADLQTMATDTGAVNALNLNAPHVYSGADANAASAVETGVTSFFATVPLDLTASADDDPADSVDAVSAFVERLETLQLGTAACANNLESDDTNADTFDDAYVNVPAGTPTCWKLVPKQNGTVPATAEPQVFRATVHVTGDGVTTLDTRNVVFVVPPAPLD